jgi:hypothetical protein
MPRSLFSNQDGVYSLQAKGARDTQIDREDLWMVALMLCKTHELSSKPGPHFNPKSTLLPTPALREAAAMQCGSIRVRTTNTIARQARGPKDFEK